jgi:hypothetical protein
VRRYIGGARVDAVLPFAPVMLGTPLSIALMSYGDRLGFGIDSDPAAIPDPDRIRALLELEIGEIERHAGRQPVEPKTGSRERRSGAGGARSEQWAVGGGP